MNLVWLKYHIGGQVLFEPGENAQYVFASRNGISLAQIPEQYVAIALSKRCGCCGSERNCFTLATEDDIKLWNSN